MIDKAARIQRASILIWYASSLFGAISRILSTIFMILVSLKIYPISCVSFVVRSLRIAVTITSWWISVYSFPGFSSQSIPQLITSVCAKNELIAQLKWNSTYCSFNLWHKSRDNFLNQFSVRFSIFQELVVHAVDYARSASILFIVLLWVVMCDLASHHSF